MKKNKMKFLKTLTFLFIFSLFSCSEDLYETESNKSNYRVSYVNSVAIQNNKELVKTLRDEKIIKTNSLNKIIIDTVNNFSIDTDFVKFLQGPNFNSYTFKIIEQEENYLDNLVLVSQEGAPYSAFIMRYNLTEQEKTALNNGQAVDFTNKAKVLKLSNSNIANDAFTKLAYEEECNWVSSWEEVVTLSIDPDQCDCYGLNNTSVSHVLIGSWACTSGGVGSDAGSDIGTSPNGGGGGGSDLTPPNPCVKLKDLLNTSKANVKPTIINDLRPNIAVNPSGEKGVSLAMNSSGVVTNTIIPTVSQPPLPISTGGNFYSAIHTHPLDTAPIFSWSDVYTLNQMNNNLATHNQGLASFLLVCQDDNNVFQTYAIVFDLNSLNDTIDQFINNPENNGCSIAEIELKMNSKLEKEYNIEYNSVNPNYEKVFLRNMFNSNITLYKANSTLTNWSKLSLSNNSATATVNSTNCN